MLAKFLEFDKMCKMFVARNSHDGKSGNPKSENLPTTALFCYSPRKSDVVATAVPFFLWGKV